MADLVSQSAQNIADALAPTPSVPSARWRWGTVVSVSNTGTMNVSIGGATVPGIRCAQHVMGAQVGDRVRVMYCGTEAIVDAVRATSDLMSVPAPSMDASTQAAWLSALGFSGSAVTLTENATNWTPSTNNSRVNGNVVNVTMTGQCKAGIGTWSGDSGYTIGTLSVHPAVWTNLVALMQISSKIVPMLCNIDANGEIHIRTAGEAVPANTWTWISGTYITS